MPYTHTAKELAGALSVSKSRVSQMVAEGKLAGCFTGEGRQRRFDPVKAARALNMTTDFGQSLGNGSAGRAARAEILGGTPPDAKPDTVLPRHDPDTAALLQEQIKAEDLKTKRRRNAQEDGTAILASAAAAQITAAIAQINADIAQMLNQAARTIADEFDVDFSAAKATLKRVHREHREKQAALAAKRAGAATFTSDEKAANAADSPLSKPGPAPDGGDAAAS